MALSAIRFDRNRHVYDYCTKEKQEAEIGGAKLYEKLKEYLQDLCQVILKLSAHNRLTSQL